MSHSVEVTVRRSSNVCYRTNVMSHKVTMAVRAAVASSARYTSILLLVYCPANVMSYSVLGEGAASGVCREEKLDVAHGVTNLPLLL